MSFTISKVSITCVNVDIKQLQVFIVTIILYFLHGQQFKLDFYFQTIHHS